MRCACRRYGSRVEGEQTAHVPQIQEVQRCLRQGLRKSSIVPHADTIAILELIDQARAELGVRYPGEGWRAVLGRGWHRGQEYDERFMNASRRMRVPHREQGLPSRP
jgi:hypothetical protein